MDEQNEIDNALNSSRFEDFTMDDLEQELEDLVKEEKSQDASFKAEISQDASLDDLTDLLSGEVDFCILHIHVSSLCYFVNVCLLILK